MHSVLHGIGSRLAQLLARPKSPATEPHVREVQRLRQTLRPGDVLLVEGQSRISTVIRYLTQSTWSHAALYIGDAVVPPDAQGCPLSLVEADLNGGVRAVSLQTYAGLHTRICRPSGLTESEIVRVVQHAASRLGQRYDLRNVFDLVRYLLPALPVPRHWRRQLLRLGSGDPTRAICSTLLAEAFESVRYPILPFIEHRPTGDPNCMSCTEEFAHGRHASLFVPRDFDVSPYFEIVKPELNSGFDPHRVRWVEAAGQPPLAMPRLA